VGSASGVNNNVLSPTNLPIRDFATGDAKEIDPAFARVPYGRRQDADRGSQQVLVYPLLERYWNLFTANQNRVLVNKVLANLEPSTLGAERPYTGTLTAVKFRYGELRTRRG